MANTKIGAERILPVRGRGGNIKNKAVRLSEGKFTLITSKFTTISKLREVMYHPSSNEFIRTNTLTKSSVVKIDAQPFLETIEKEGLRSKDALLNEIIDKGYLYAIVDSRPGQVGMVEGHVLQGNELVFYTGFFKKNKI